MEWHSGCNKSPGSLNPSWQHMISVSLSTKAFTFSVLSTSSEAPEKKKKKIQVANHYIYFILFSS